MFGVCSADKYIQKITRCLGKRAIKFNRVLFTGCPFLNFHIYRLKVLTFE